MQLLLLQRRYLSATAINKSENLKSTLRLPKTTFPSKPPVPDKAAHRALLLKCTEELYKRQTNREAVEEFVLHDGPPYANGDLHMGHALNKILKDIINRVQILEGKRVRYIPGWDCHGLPIELKALQNLSVSQAKTTKEQSESMTALEIRSLARGLAGETVAAQMAGFKEWAVMADWDCAYLTMDKHYELLQLRVFKDMVSNGLVYRRFKPVYWSPSSGTALAEAELEYNEKHVSKAAFVKFELREKLLDEEGSASLVVWTTTPWTLPANKAVAVGLGMEYVVIQTPSHGNLLVANARVGYLQNILGLEKIKILRSDILGKSLVGLNYIHPLLPADTPAHPIIAADFVSEDSGTGLVHLAPGHGMDDYLVCLSHNIAPFSPVDNNGRYTADTLSELHGKEVLYGGTKAVLQLLQDRNALLHLNNKFVHKYPYDWRTKLPIIVRATAQWFADVDGIKLAAVKALENVQFVPEGGRARLTSFVKGRNEWCISRQRAWGVPIPALYNIETGEPLMTEDNVDHIVAILKEKGTDAWFAPDIPDEVFVAPQYQFSNKKYERGKETMDVWFDSGTSWAILSSRLSRSEKDDRRQQPISDLYLEGSDQHRGWFQSSLLTSVAATGFSPFRTILTHGFCLDAAGKKMSKSLGNVIRPSDIISGRIPSGTSPPGGIDVLRLWVAYSDFSRDVTIGPKTLSHIHRVLSKARVTIKFLLGNLTDYAGPIPYSITSPLDRLALAHVSNINNQVRSAFSSFNFNKAVSLLSSYTTNNLSAFYLDVVKDCLYCSARESPERKSVQFALIVILRNYVSLLAPLVPLLKEETWSHACATVLDAVPEEERMGMRFFEPDRLWTMPEHDCSVLIRQFELLEKIVGAKVRLAIESAKAKGLVKVNLETEVMIELPLTTKTTMDGSSCGGSDSGVGVADLVWMYRNVLEQLWIVSGVTVLIRGHNFETPSNQWQEVQHFSIDGGGQGMVLVRQARGEKCVRCWVYKAPTCGGLCARCEKVLETI